MIVVRMWDVIKLQGQWWEYQIIDGCLWTHTWFKDAELLHIIILQCLFAALCNVLKVDSPLDLRMHGRFCWVHSCWQGMYASWWGLLAIHYWYGRLVSYSSLLWQSCQQFISALMDTAATLHSGQLRACLLACYGYYCLLHFIWEPSPCNIAIVLFGVCDQCVELRSHFGVSI